MSAGEYVAWVAHPAAEPRWIVAGAGVQLRRLLPRPGRDGERLKAGRPLYERIGFVPTSEMRYTGNLR